ncbi:hypothetical protein HYH03_017412 [Edaphochlamys debaryana]|uniref:Peptidase S8/S53 domain-containing protein n=1 Tax=Edaphochlamys debaryana TaxID=47281 RepID=A0A835XII0_9CHLO|nr:hypothetical protein HYH03_017412 [Edaphochlamys debaryana]|eukprot:KAG2483757.1 hypothetical protein HYH03_017412 [Edaphochlamys debaryana]
MRSAKVSARLLQEFSTAWDGFSLQADDVDAALAALDEDFEVLSIFPVVWLPGPDTTVVDVDVRSLKGSYLVADAAAPTSNTTSRLAAGGYRRLDGWDVKVGIIDTGVDYKHPAFGGDMGDGMTVAYGWDFAGDSFKPGGVPTPDADPMDCAGHGTHVAGIIAGILSDPSGFKFQGVAPGVTLGAYKVFGCSGGTTSELVVAALDQAARDGMQIINLSVGDEGAWNGPVAESVARLAAMGTIVVGAAGNAGSAGLFMQTSVASAAPTIAVGSVQSLAAGTSGLSLTISGAFGTVRTVNALISYGDTASLVSAVVKPSAAALAAGAAATSASSDGCNSAVLGDLAGTVALISSGGCAPAVKAANVLSRGGIGIVLYGDASALAEVSKPPAAWLAPYTPYGLPLAFVDADTGRVLFDTYRTMAAVAPSLNPLPSPSPPPSGNPLSRTPPVIRASLPPPAAALRPSPRVLVVPRPPSPRPPPADNNSGNNGNGNGNGKGNGKGGRRRLIESASGASAGKAALLHGRRRDLLSVAGPADEGQRAGMRQLLQGAGDSGMALPTILAAGGSLVSRFSSWGPSPDLLIKPSLIAPGGGVLSTVPVTPRSDNGRASTSGFAVMAGTSQAAPYVAAAAALYLQANQGSEPSVADVESALVCTAKPAFDLSAPASAAVAGALPASAFRVGGGVVDIAAMATNLADVSPCKLELGSGLSQGKGTTFTIDVTNRGSAPLTFRLLHRPAASVDASTILSVSAVPGTANNSRRADAFAPAALPAAAVLGISAVRVGDMDTVTIPGNGKSRFKVTIGLASWVSKASKVLLSGYLVMDPLPPTGPSNNPAVQAAALQPPLYLPYVGYSASFSDLPVLLPSSPGGLTTPTGSWWWDDGAAGYSTLYGAPPPMGEAPPPEGYDPEGDDDQDDSKNNGKIPSGNPRPPQFSYALGGPKASLPALALWLQRQPAGQELHVFSASTGNVQVGYVSLQQTIRRQPDGSPMVLTWRGSYYDLKLKREVFASPGDYYFEVRLRRPNAAADSDQSLVYDVWQTPVFRLTKS